MPLSLALFTSPSVGKFSRSHCGGGGQRPPLRQKAKAKAATNGDFDCGLAVRRGGVVAVREGVPGGDWLPTTSSTLTLPVLTWAPGHNLWWRSLATCISVTFRAKVESNNAVQRLMMERNT